MSEKNDSVIFRIVNSLPEPDDKNRIEKIAIFREEKNDKLHDPKTPSFLLDEIKEDHLVAKISLDANTGFLIPKETFLGKKQNGRYYTTQEAIDIVNASQLAYQNANYSKDDYGRIYCAQILAIALDYNLFNNSRIPRFIPFLCRSVGGEDEKINNMINWVKKCLETCELGETLFFPWLAKGHAGMIAVDSKMYKNKEIEYLRYFEMGGMYLCEGVINKDGSFNGKKEFKDRSNINKCFGEFAKHIEGYNSENNEPVPVCFDFITRNENNSKSYGQRFSDTDCSYRSEAAYCLYMKGDINNFEDFKENLGSKEKLDLINNFIKGRKYRARLRLKKPKFYYTNLYHEKNDIFPKISINYENYEGYPETPWIPKEIEDSLSIEQNKETDLINQIKYSNSQAIAVASGNKIMSNDIKSSKTTLNTNKEKQSSNPIKQIETNEFGKKILEKNDIDTTKREKIEHLKLAGRTLAEKVSKVIIGIDSKEQVKKT